MFITLVLTIILATRIPHLDIPTRAPQIMADHSNVENMRNNKEKVEICHRCFGSGGKINSIFDPYITLTESDAAMVIFPKYFPLD